MYKLLPSEMYKIPTLQNNAFAPSALSSGTFFRKTRFRFQSPEMSQYHIKEPSASHHPRYSKFFSQYIVYQYFHFKSLIIVREIHLSVILIYYVLRACNSKPMFFLFLFICHKPHFISGCFFHT